MLDQIRIKQTYTNRNSKKQQEKRKKKLKKTLVSYKKYIIILATVLVLWLWLLVAQRYFLNNTKFIVQEITYLESDKTFMSTGVINTLDQKKNTNYWKIKRNIDSIINQLQDPWIQDIITRWFDENVLQVDIFYNSPEIIFKDNDITRWSINKSIRLLSWSLIDPSTPTFSLPTYHTGSIEGIFHKVNDEELQLWHTSLSTQISPDIIEFHPWINKIIAFKWPSKIMFDIDDPIQQQVDKYVLITEYFSGNQALEYDLSSAPYAIIKQ
jgi:hypothetical protein